MLLDLFAVLLQCAGSRSEAAEAPEKEELELPAALPSFTTLLPAEEKSTSSTGSSASDQPEITVPTLVPGMITPGSVQESPSGSFPSTKGVHNVTKIDLKAISGRSPEAVEFLSCDSSDSVEAALSSDRVSRSDARSPSKRSRTQSPTSRRPTILSVAHLLQVSSFFHFGPGKGSQNWFRKFNDFIFLEHILWKYNTWHVFLKCSPILLCGLNMWQLTCPESWPGRKSGGRFAWSCLGWRYKPRPGNATSTQLLGPKSIGYGSVTYSNPFLCVLKHF